MKKLPIVLLLLTIISCNKEDDVQTNTKMLSRNASTSVSDPTTIEITSPFQTEGAIYSNNGWVLNGVLQPWPTRTLNDSFNFSFKLHVGNRLVKGGKYKPEKVTNVAIFVNGKQLKNLIVPNDGGPGTYYFSDKVYVPKECYANHLSYYNLNPSYCWDYFDVWARSNVYENVSYNYWFKNIFIKSQL